MSIQNIPGVGINQTTVTTGNIQEVSNFINNLLDSARSALAVTGEGFVGIDTANYTILTDAIEDYVIKLENIINNFNTDAYIDGALKGQARDEAVLYVKAIKDLLSAYITNYREFNRLLTGHVHGQEISDGSVIGQMIAGDQQNAQAINSEAQAIQTEAQSIRID